MNLLLGGSFSQGGRGEDSGWSRGAPRGGKRGFEFGKRFFGWADHGLKDRFLSGRQGRACFSRKEKVTPCEKEGVFLSPGGPGKRVNALLSHSKKLTSTRP